MLAEARSAVGNIKSESLSEIRSLRAPPDVIRDILEGVLRLMGIQDTSWNSMKTFLAKRGVKEDIRFGFCLIVKTLKRLKKFPPAEHAHKYHRNIRFKGKNRSN